MFEPIHIDLHGAILVVLLAQRVSNDHIKVLLIFIIKGLCLTFDIGELVPQILVLSFEFFNIFLKLLPNCL